MTDRKQPEAPADAEPDAGVMSEDEIDQNLADTFPASDPPSWTLGTNHADSRTQPSDATDDAKEK